MQTCGKLVRLGARGRHKHSLVPAGEVPQMAVRAAGTVGLRNDTCSPFSERRHLVIQGKERAVHVGVDGQRESAVRPAGNLVCSHAGASIARQGAV